MISQRPHLEHACHWSILKSLCTSFVYQHTLSRGQIHLNWAATTPMSSIGHLAHSLCQGPKNSVVSQSEADTTENHTACIGLYCEGTTKISPQWRGQRKLQTLMVIKNLRISRIYKVHILLIIIYLKRVKYHPSNNAQRWQYKKMMYRDWLMI